MCLWEEAGDLFFDVETAMAELVVQKQLAIQMVDAMLDQMCKLSIKCLNVAIAKLIVKFQVDLLVARHKKSDERNGKALLLDFNWRPFGTYYLWVDVCRIISRVAVVRMSKSCIGVVTVYQEYPLQTFNLVGGYIQHSMTCSQVLHLLHFLEDGAIEGYSAGRQFEGQTIALLSSEYVGNIQHLAWIGQSPLQSS